MPKEWTPPPEPYVGSSDPIALSSETYARHSKAVETVLGDNQARYPRAGRGRTTGAAAGAWAVLKSGATISASSGLSLGSGTVTMCSRDGTTLTADGEVITVYNAGDTITAGSGDRVVKLSWVDVWVASRCG